jgi:DNA-binding MarR family transcriptional regulator
MIWSCIISRRTTMYVLAGLDWALRRFLKFRQRDNNMRKIKALQSITVKKRATSVDGRPGKSTRLDESLGYLVRKTHHAIVSRLDERLVQHGISPSTWAFLRRLWDEDGLTQKELADALGLTPPTAVSALDSLERRGFVQRRLNGSDRRKRHIYLTASARNLVAELRPLATEVNDIALAELSDAEAKELMRLLHKVSDSLLRAASSVQDNALVVVE